MTYHSIPLLSYSIKIKDDMCVILVKYFLLLKKKTNKILEIRKMHWILTSKIK